MRKKRSKPRIGSSLDDFLRGEGVLEAFKTIAVNEVTAWQRRTPKTAGKARKRPAGQTRRSHAT
jgi:hypothetical protein